MTDPEFFKAYRLFIYPSVDLLGYQRSVSMVASYRTPDPPVFEADVILIMITL